MRQQVGAIPCASQVGWHLGKASINFTQQHLKRSISVDAGPVIRPRGKELQGRGCSTAKVLDRKRSLSWGRCAIRDLSCQRGIFRLGGYCNKLTEGYIKLHKGIHSRPQHQSKMVVKAAESAPPEQLQRGSPSLLHRVDAFDKSLSAWLYADGRSHLRGFLKFLELSGKKPDSNGRP